eukprot:7507663-Lingulodinium_polyedra.AAC.1
MMVAAVIVAVAVALCAPGGGPGGAANVASGWRLRRDLEHHGLIVHCPPSREISGNRRHASPAAEQGAGALRRPPYDLG